MNKFFLNLFVVSALILSVSCSGSDDSNDDDGGGGDEITGQIVVTIGDDNPVVTTFNEINIDNNTNMNEQITVTASIDNDPSKILQFTVNEGSTDFPLQQMSYTLNGVCYCFSPNFVQVAITNDGSMINVNFSGDFEETDDNALIFSNGNVSISY